MLKTKKEKTMFNLKNVSKIKNVKVMMMTLMMCLMTMFIVSCGKEKTLEEKTKDFLISEMLSNSPLKGKTNIEVTNIFSDTVYVFQQKSDEILFKNFVSKNFPLLSMSYIDKGIGNPVQHIRYTFNGFIDNSELSTKLPFKRYVDYVVNGIRARAVMLKYADKGFDLDYKFDDNNFYLR